MNQRFSLFLLCLFGLGSACSQSPSSSSSPKPTPRNVTVEETSPQDDERSDNEVEAEQDTDRENENLETDESEASTEEVARISQSRAQSILQASCMAAGCHADLSEIINAATLIQQLEDELMPPPNQARYTLSDKSRAELILYFSSQ